MNKKPCTLQDYLLLQSVKICLIWIIFMPFALLAFSGRVAGTNKNKRDRKKNKKFNKVCKSGLFLGWKSMGDWKSLLWRWQSKCICNWPTIFNLSCSHVSSVLVEPQLLQTLTTFLIPFTDFFPIFVSFSYNSVWRSHFFFLLCVILKLTSVTCIITFTSESEALPYCTTLLKYIRFWHTFS